MNNYYRFKVKGMYLKLTTGYQFIIRNSVFKNIVCF